MTVGTAMVLAIALAIAVDDTIHVLVAGFLSMRTNGLVAIRNMGVVVAATLAVAFLVDAAPTSADV